MRLPYRVTRAGPVLTLLVVMCIPGRVLAASRTFEYLYINASEGSASGGHAAIKFGDEVFHFQHVPPGLLRITKEDFGVFRHQYGYQENRTIRAHRIEVAENTFAWLNEAFNRRLLIQDEHFAQLQALDRDCRLVEALQNLAGRGGAKSPSATAPTIELKALGISSTKLGKCNQTVPGHSSQRTHPLRPCEH